MRIVELKIMIRMKSILFCLSLFFTLPLLAKSTYSKEISILLNELDSLVAQKDALQQLKEQQIDRLRIQLQHTSSTEERYKLNQKLYNEFWFIRHFA